MHNHLLINHLPLFGALFGLIIVIVSLVVKSSALRITALSLLMVGGLSFYPTFETGEQAHHEIEERKDFDKASHRIMHTHEDAAKAAAPFVLGMGVLALIGIILEARKSKYSAILSAVVAVLGIVAMFMLAKVNNTGGQIRHPELRTETGTNTQEKPNNTKDDD